MRLPQVLEDGFYKILNGYFYHQPVKELPDRLEFYHRRPERPTRHNYQRAILHSEEVMRIRYRGMDIAECSRLPYPQVKLIRRNPEEAPKGYFAAKILERTLFYRFQGVKYK